MERHWTTLTCSAVIGKRVCKTYKKERAQLEGATGVIRMQGRSRKNGRILRVRGSARGLPRTVCRVFAFILLCQTLSKPTLAPFTPFFYTTNPSLSAVFFSYPLSFGHLLGTFFVQRTTISHQPLPRPTFVLSSPVRCGIISLAFAFNEQSLADGKVVVGIQKTKEAKKKENEIQQQDERILTKN